MKFPVYPIRDLMNKDRSFENDLLLQLLSLLIHTMQKIQCKKYNAKNTYFEYSFISECTSSVILYLFLSFI